MVFLLTNKYFSNNMKVLIKSQIERFVSSGQDFEDNNLVIFIVTIILI